MEESTVMSEIHYAQFQNISSETTRITEADDTRITEQDDIRITSDTANNAAESSLVANATKIPFVSSQFYNDEGVWKQILQMYVKYEGEWISPSVVYKNVNGVWKRVK